MKSLLFALLLVTSLALGAQPDHAAFTAVLASHVRDGKVDYASIKRDGRFAPYLALLASTKVSTLSSAEKKAFWINAYNAFTIKVVCDNFPLRSIRDLAQGKIWDRPLVKIDGQTYSLNEIENDILRPMGDHRIHFALVCAARSCPPLRTEAYDPARLDEQLTEQGRLFLRSSPLNVFDTSTRTARMSHVFEWYLADFGRTHADLLRTIAPYTSEDVRSALTAEASRWTVQWLDYDWSLNGK
jgi:hypothetical protein